MEIDKYELIHPLGEGGFGSVFLARDQRLDRPVAIKKMEVNESTENEISVLKSLRNEALPVIYDCIKKDGELYMVMEYVEGITLKEYLAVHKKVPKETAFYFINSICDIIIYLHEQSPSIIYRDLKPSNIMIQKDGKIKLVDFGSAYLNACSAKRERFVAGTKGYSAPESLKNAPVSFSSDIYSIGVILFEMLTGKGPNDKEFLYPLTSLDPKCTRHIQKVIEKCLNKDPKERFSSVRDLKVRLNESPKERMAEEVIYVLKKAVVLMGYTNAFLVAFIPLYCKKMDGINMAESLKALFSWGLAFLIHKTFLYMSKENYMMKTEKSLFLTGKKYLGLYGLMIMGLGLIGIMGSVNHKKDENTLWVEMRDVNERKMLLKDDGIYKVDDMLRLEIPASSIPDKNFTVRVIAMDDDGERYVSRRFCVINN